MNLFSKIKDGFKNIKKLSKLKISLLIVGICLILVSFVPIIKYQVDKSNSPSSQPSKEEQFKQAQKYNFVVYKYDFKLQKFVISELNQWRVKDRLLFDLPKDLSLMEDLKLEAKEGENEVFWSQQLDKNTDQKIVLPMILSPKVFSLSLKSKENTIWQKEITVYYEKV